MKHEGIYKLNPQIVVVRGDVAYDIDGNEVEYDKAAAQAKLAELEAAEQAALDAQAAAKESALAKLKKLGLTEEEALALGVTK